QGNSGKVRAYSAFSNTACATTLALPVPAAPSAVYASPDFSSRIRVVWVDNATNESGFRVERAASGAGPWTNLATLGPNVLSFDDWAAPAPELRACYRVVAFNSYGDSPWSNIACTARPAPPSALSATVLGHDVDLTWTDNSSLEDGYEVQRWTEDFGAGVITLVAQLPANTTTYRDVGLPDGKYWYQVRAMKDGRATGSSNNADVTILTGPPATPISVVALASSSTMAAVLWTDNSTNEDGFRIDRSTDGGGTWAAAGYGNVPYWSSSGDFRDEGQPSEQELCYRVIAFNSLGESAPSNSSCTMLPLGPTGLTATGISPQTIELTWTDNSAVEDGYEVQALYYYCEYDEWGQCIPTPYRTSIATLSSNATRFQHTGLTSGESWTYRVVALRGSGRSDVSNEVSAFVP
ncbi:MAG TPA: fibronectin type III domain-containing protein, partial [Gemmatimonadales bacterium]|nr:fibronectin type III domain-containing protein [Gemmatimonadales bacterium]